MPLEDRRLQNLASALGVQKGSHSTTNRKGEKEDATGRHAPRRKRGKRGRAAGGGILEKKIIAKEKSGDEPWRVKKPGCPGVRREGRAQGSPAIRNV